MRHKELKKRPCVYCGKLLHKKNMTCDEPIPKGMTKSKHQNKRLVKVPACFECNSLIKGLLDAEATHMLGMTSLGPNNEVLHKKIKKHLPNHRIHREQFQSKLVQINDSIGIRAKKSIIN